MNRFAITIKMGALCLLLLLALHFKAAAQAFEGVIHYEVPEMNQNGMKGGLAYMIKGSKVRMEFGEGIQKGAMLYYPNESKMIFLIDKMKSYMAMSLDSTAYDKEDDVSEWDVEKTGQTKTIAGLRCEIWNMTNKDKQFDLCMAGGMGTFMMPRSPMNGRANMPEWAKEAMDKDMLPLEVVNVKDDGSRQVQMRVTKVEEKELANSLFEVPEDYRDMSSMMQQMMKQRQH